MGRRWRGLLLLTALLTGLAGAAPAEGIRILSAEPEENGRILLEWSGEGDSFDVSALYCRSLSGPWDLAEEIRTGENRAEITVWPGTDMAFLVESPEGGSRDILYTPIPEKEFGEFAVTARIRTGCLRKGREEEGELSAAGLSRWLRGLSGEEEAEDYRFRFSFGMPALGRPRVYDVLVLLEDPEGHAARLLLERDSRFDTLSLPLTWQYPWMSLGDAFYCFLADRGRILPGEYGVRMYLNGALAARTEFRVGE